MKLKFPVKFLGAWLCIITMPALAHHGWNGNDDEQFELTGIVEAPVSLAGAHASMKIRVKGEVWDITLAPPARTKRAGLEEATIPVGAEVTVSGHRSKEESRREMKTERVTYKGKIYNVYPDRD